MSEHQPSEVDEEHNQSHYTEYDEENEDPLAKTNRTGADESENTADHHHHQFGGAGDFHDGSTGIGGSQYDLGGRRKSTLSHGTQGPVSHGGSMININNDSSNVAAAHLDHTQNGEDDMLNGEDGQQNQQQQYDDLNNNQDLYSSTLPCNVSPAAPLPQDPIEGALNQFPVGFLKYSPETEVKVVPVGSLDPFLPPRLASQRHSLSEAPVVTGSMDTVLDALLPPRRTTVTYINEEEGVQDTVDVVQRVSHSQIKREELRQLRYELDARLRESNSRREGICSVRRGIHALMFDELIRQVTIDCPERGILLRRVRDEIQMTLDSYHTLYEESVAYSTNRCVAASKYTPAMTLAIDGLNGDITELRKELRKLQAKESAMLRCVSEQEDSDHRRHEEERLFLERTQQRLQTQLEAVKEAQEAQRRALREQAF